MIGSLQGLESLLRKYEQPCLASAVSLALNHANARDERLWTDLCSGDWWGDSDSIAAIEPAVPGGFSRDARADSRRLRERMLIIYAGMQTHCVPPPEARLMANQFNKWLTSLIQAR